MDIRLGVSSPDGQANRSNEVHNLEGPRDIARGIWRPGIEGEWLSLTKTLYSRWRMALPVSFTQNRSHRYRGGSTDAATVNQISSINSSSQRSTSTEWCWKSNQWQKTSRLQSRGQGPLIVELAPKLVDENLLAQFPQNIAHVLFRVAFRDQVNPRLPS
jgi:hypothetical protein